MHKVLMRLKEDHKNLARLLKIMEHQLDNFHRGDEPDFEIMGEMLEYVESYADQIHHPTEELIFRILQQKLPAQRVLMELLVNQHETLSFVCKKFRQSLDGIVQGDVLRRDEVEAQGRHLVQLMRNHLAQEDQDVFPLVDKTLSDQDWDSVHDNAPKLADPLFGDPDSVRFRSLYNHLMNNIDN